MHSPWTVLLWWQQNPIVVSLRAEKPTSDLPIWSAALRGRGRMRCDDEAKQEWRTDVDVSDYHGRMECDLMFTVFMDNFSLITVFVGLKLLSVLGSNCRVQLAWCALSFTDDIWSKWETLSLDALLSKMYIYISSGWDRYTKLSGIQNGFFQ